MTLILNGERIPLTKRVTSLGRSRERDVVVVDPNVSRQHCEIRHVGYDYFLIDLDSTNGVSVNGRPVTRHALADGDVITMGATQIRVEVS
jgi:pSer/pThr/pTyr-binding forkhead associated (FHA) protein